MALVVDGGGLVNKGGALGTGAACCCPVDCGLNCPCNYLKTLPDTLSAELIFTLPDTIYGASVENFFAAVVRCTRLTAEQAASVNGTYVLSRETSCGYRVDTGSVRIGVEIGGTTGCQQGQASVQLVELFIRVPASFPASPGGDSYTGGVNTFCNGLNQGFLSNAAGRAYTDNTLLSSTSQPQRFFCNTVDPFFNSSFAFGTVAGSAILPPGGRDEPPCSQIPIRQIDHSWLIDIIYTNTAGAAPAAGTVSRAVSLTVEENPLP